MGMLSASEDADLLDPASWTKERYPVLASDEALEIYGPGHNSFTTDEEGGDICVYHARKEAVIEGDPLYNPNRHTMLMKVQWSEEMCIRDRLTSTSLSSVTERLFRVRLTVPSADTDTDS